MDGGGGSVRRGGTSRIVNAGLTLLFKVWVAAAALLLGGCCATMPSDTGATVTLISTYRELDVAVQGPGYIAVQGLDGREAYTRAGDLHVDATGQLLTSSNLPVLGDGGPIALPPYSSVNIGSDGTVAIVPLGQGPEIIAVVGDIKLVNPGDDALKKGADGLLRMKDGSAAPADPARRLVSGVLESSNVNIASIMARMKYFTQGKLERTGNSLDVAINGRGFFQVLAPNGSVAYTRDGSFKIGPEGELVTVSGYRHHPGISIPSGAQWITICIDGTVSVTMAGQAAPTQVGTLQLTDFVNRYGLEPSGDKLLVATAASGAARTGNPGVNGLGLLQQGFVEGSNVD